MRKDDIKQGYKFGRLTVIEEVKPHIQPSGQPKRMFKCQCDCGNIIETQRYCLTSGTTKSCGCLKSELTSKRMSKYEHDANFKRLYKIWLKMKERCYNPNAQFYNEYGGRGIYVCDEWKNDFPAFRDWSITHGYRSDLSIDKIDNNKSYCPDNCRWATIIEQARNKRNNVYATINGKTKLLKEWSEEYGVPYKTIHKRYNEGWRGEKLLIDSQHKIQVGNDFYTIKEIAHIAGVTDGAIRQRILHGWAGEELFKSSKGEKDDKYRKHSA